MEAVSFQSEIQAIMHACGDSKRASRESAALIESIVHAEITRVCRDALSPAQTEEKQLESLFFLMRRDRSRLKQVLRNASYKKLAKQVHRSASDDSLEDPLYGCGGLKLSLSVSFLDPIGADTRLDFCSLLEKDAPDWLDRERYERYETLTRPMSTQQYLDFTECRAVNFTRKPQKLREWLCLSEERGGVRLIELLGYLCYDAVRKLVETGLECREREQNLSDLLDAVSAPVTQSDVTRQESAGSTGVSSRPLKRASTHEQDQFPPLVSTSPLSSLRPQKHKRGKVQPPLPFHPLHPPLLPGHIREAYRRICGDNPISCLLGTGRVSGCRLRKAQRLIF